MGLFIDLLMHTIDASPILGIIWLALLIDCFVNTELRGPQKVWWIFFIFIAQFLGALIYFFLGPSQIYRRITGRNRQYQSMRARQANQPVYYHPMHNYPPAQPMPSLPEVPLAEYEQGYRAQEPATPSATQDVSASDTLYEQPQAMYPEMTQQQQ